MELRVEDLGLRVQGPWLLTGMGLSRVLSDSGHLANLCLASNISNPLPYIITCWEYWGEGFDIRGRGLELHVPLCSTQQ